MMRLRLLALVVIASTIYLGCCETVRDRFVPPNAQPQYAVRVDPNRHTVRQNCNSTTCQYDGECIDIGSGMSRCGCHPFLTGGSCQLEGLIDFARSDCEITCTASDEVGSCYNTIDDDLLAGDWFVGILEDHAWIKFHGNQFVMIAALKIQQRCNQNNQISRIGVTVDDGSVQSIDLACHDSGFNDFLCDDIYWQNFDLELKVTKNVLLNITGACNSYGSIGAKEIKIYVYDIALVNIAAGEIGGTCTASSEYNYPDFRCENALNDILDPTIVGSEFAFDGVYGDVGQWLDIFFLDEYYIVVVDVLTRCMVNQQIQTLQLDFSRGDQRTFSLDSLGGAHPYDCAGQDFQPLLIRPAVKANSVRLTLMDMWEPVENNPGFREVRVWAIETSPIDPRTTTVTPETTTGTPTTQPVTGDFNASETFCKVDSGDITSYIETVTIGNATFDVPVSVLPNGEVWMTLMSRKDGSVPFENYGWMEYRNGFGNLYGGEFWLGLERMNLLTTNGSIYTMRVDLVTDAGVCYYALFRPFSVGDEAGDYTLNWGPVAPEQDTNDPNYAGDGQYLNDHQQKFTTWDNDNDPYPTNCATRYNGGWWYNQCVASKLTGIYKQLPSSESIRWFTLPNSNNVIMDVAELKIKVY